MQDNHCLESLSGLPKALPEIRTLSFLVWVIQDLSGLPRMPKLEALVLANTGIEEIDGLDGKCPNLVSLDIRGTRVKSLIGLPASVKVLYVGDDR